MKVDAHETSAMPEGVTEYQGPDAAAEVARTVRAAQLGGDVDPLDRLAARITAEKRPELALDPLVLDAAAALREVDPVAFDVLRRDLKAAAVAITGWSQAIDVRAREAKRLAKEADQRAAREEALRRRIAMDAARAARAAERAAQATAASTELAAHYAEANCDQITYTMVPGRITRVAPGPRGEDRTTTLATFSAVLVAMREDYATPDARPSREYVLSIVAGEGGAPREFAVPAAEWVRCEWPERYGVGGTVFDGRGTRDQLRVAIEVLSPSPETRRRYGFTGWCEHQARWVYLHAAGAVGAEGAVPGVAVAPQGHAVAYALPAMPEGEDLARALGSVRSFLAVEPAGVAVPLVAAAFRAALGPSRCTLHIAGEKGNGKTFLAKLAGAFFAPTLDPLSWADGSTANGLQAAMVRAGNAVVVVDDLRVNGTHRDGDGFALFDRVTRAHFNRAAPAKQNRDGTSRETAASRCLLVSTGEVIPHGASCLERVLTVVLDAKVDVASLLPLREAATRGESAGVMAVFLRWLAPQVADVRSDLEALERDAAARWGVVGTDRAQRLAGELALGLEFFARFVRETTGEVLDADRLRAALVDLAGAQRALVAEEAPALQFVRLVSAQLHAGAAHVTRRGPAGLTTKPKDPERWGWQIDRDGGEWRPRGLCIGRIRTERPGEVVLFLKPALSVARAMAQATGHPLAADERTIARGLSAAGYLVSQGHTVGRESVAVQVRVGGGKRETSLALREEVLTMGDDDPGEVVE